MKSRAANTPQHGVFHSVVFFIGDCELETPLPENVLTSGLPRYVKAFKSPVLSPERVAEIEKRLLALKSDRALNAANQLASLEQRYGSETTCPKCGGELLKRPAVPDLLAIHLETRKSVQELSKQVI